MHLYIKSDLSLEEVAVRISERVLPGYESQLRDGLNLGGGEYFKFSRDDKQILLVCNDDEHLEVFMEAYQAFPYYCYARKGADDLLDEMKVALSQQGFECELGDDA